MVVLPALSHLHLTMAHDGYIYKLQPIHSKSLALAGSRRERTFEQCPLFVKPYLYEYKIMSAIERAHAQCTLIQRLSERCINSTHEIVAANSDDDVDEDEGSSHGGYEIEDGTN